MAWVPLAVVVTTGDTVLSLARRDSQEVLGTGTPDDTDLLFTGTGLPGKEVLKARGDRIARHVA